MKTSSNTARADLQAIIAAHEEALAATLPRRQNILEARLIRNSQLLDQDIEQWKSALSILLPNTPIEFHVNQFSIFYKAARECLQTQYAAAIHIPGEDRVLFEMQIVGALAVQWSALRAVASQRLPDHPYARALQRLEGDLGQMYWRMCRALVEAGVDQAKEWPLPLLYLGRLAEIALPDKQRTPALIGIPFGAAYNESEALPIAHELGHLPGSKIDRLLDQIKRQSRKALHDAKLPHADLLEQEILPWIGEIIADLFGTSLAGGRFVVSAIELMTAPEHLVSATDREHPVALIRPYVHIRLLTYLGNRQELQTVRDALAQYFEKDQTPETAEACLDQLTAALLIQRLELSDLLAPLTLGAVKQALLVVVEHILRVPLPALGHHTLGDVLTRCADSSPANGGPGKPTKWGDITDAECETFVLRRPRPTESEWPGPTLRDFDDFLRWLQQALGTKKP